MRNFIKLVLANLTAFFLVGLFLFAFMIFIIIAAVSGKETKKTDANSVLTLDYRTKILESPNDNEQGIFSFKTKEKTILLQDALKAIEIAKTDDNIKGISIETDDINAGITQIDDIRSALEDFKKSGKFVYAYGNNVSQSAYYLGSVAQKYFLNPAGGIELKGLSAEVVFFKEFADKYGIGMDVIRHGKFKAAVEPFLRNDMSPENKEQMSTLLNDIWGNISAKITKSRNLDAQNFKTVTDSLYATIPDLAVTHKLADVLAQKGEYENFIKNKINADKDDDLNKISLANYAESLISVEKTTAPIAVLYASGEIFSGQGYNNIYSQDFIKNIREIKDDENIKAVVLRVNSPGGSANASDEILFELQQLKTKKPIVVSFGDYAASGGYYISMAADKIYAEPNTITGSIGVFGMVPNAKNLANRNGIHAESVATNANSNMASTINGVSPYGLNMMTKNVEQTYKRFVYFVSKNRKTTPENIDAIGGGRVWSGTAGKANGLVDEIGSLNDAINYAAKIAKADSKNTEVFPKEKNKFEQLFDDSSEESISAKILKSKLTDEEFSLYKLLLNPDKKNMMQARTLYHIGL